MSYGDGRPVWHVGTPAGGWPPPWPQLVEIIKVIPHQQWTLIGGVMIQLHAAHAGMALPRTTRAIDMILHIETGAATFSGVREQLEKLKYVIHEPHGDGPVHRFYRGENQDEQVDVMVADHLAPSKRPKVLRRRVFGVPGGTSALRKTVNCEVDLNDGTVIVLSIPDTLGALVLKGAAYMEDSRDRERHLDDAAILACAVTQPVQERKRLIGSDSRRLRELWDALSDPNHKSWNAVGELARRGRAALSILAE